MARRNNLGPVAEPATDGRGKPLPLRVNGVDYALEVEPRRTLLDALREDLGLTGTKKVCDVGECGACTVIIDGRAVYSCLTLAVECEGREIRTVEGLLTDERLHPVQQAFLEHDAYQCGYCTPGQIMSATALLEANPHPKPDEIRRALSGNLCRCAAYPKILEAVQAAAGQTSGEA
jgi:xanthine dehydrogenase YagT iron-sulfur-binding subunit